MKNEHGFVTALISSGKEVGDLPEIYSTGTYVEIIDWETLENTLLAITIKGIRRIKLISTSSIENGLMTAKTKELIAPSNNTFSIELENKYNNLVETLQQLSQHHFVSQKYSELDYSSPMDVCCRLSELLPASNTQKQDLLETIDISPYIEKLDEIIKSISGQ